MYYTVIKHSEHLRTLEKCRNTRLPLVFSTFPSCSQMPVLFYHSVMQGSSFFICWIRFKTIHPVHASLDQFENAFRSYPVYICMCGRGVIIDRGCCSRELFSSDVVQVWLHNVLLLVHKLRIVEQEKGRVRLVCWVLDNLFLMLACYASLQLSSKSRCATLSVAFKPLQTKMFEIHTPGQTSVRFSWYWVQ